MSSISLHPPPTSSPTHMQDAHIDCVSYNGSQEESEALLVGSSNVRGEEQQRQLTCDKPAGVTLTLTEATIPISKTTKECRELLKKPEVLRPVVLTSNNFCTRSSASSLHSAFPTIRQRVVPWTKTDNNNPIQKSQAIRPASCHVKSSPLLGGQPFCSPTDDEDTSRSPPHSNHPAEQSETLGGLSWAQIGGKGYHTVMEIITTERSYTSDLRVLVYVYLDQLPQFFVLSPELEKDVSRNVIDILNLHEELVKGLGDLEDQLKRSDVGPSSFNRLVNDMSKIFIALSAQFAAYQQYCAGHPQALEVLHPLLSRSEWEAFEKRCSLLAAGANTHQLDVPAKPLSGVPSIGFPESLSRPVSPRLSMMDYLIKPVQRICKYPLLLSQIQALYRKRQTANQVASSIFGWEEEDSETEVEVLLDTHEEMLNLAVEVMKGVATKVDQARKIRESATKACLITARLEAHFVVNSSFLIALGDHLLIGSLDVVYHHPIFASWSTASRAKYLGVLLYPGYLLLVKVKKGKVYEVKHWFPNASFDVIDLDPDRAILPWSIRLASKGHTFELGAQCRQEKDIWLKALSEAKGLPPGREDSSLPFTADDIGFAKPVEGGESASQHLQALESKAPHVGGHWIHQPKAASAPTTPMRSNFATSPPEAVQVRRTSAAYCSLVDRELSDVLSECCLVARTQARVNGRSCHHFGRSDEWRSTEVAKKSARRDPLSGIFGRATAAEACAPSYDTEKQDSLFRANSFSTFSRLTLPRRKRSIVAIPSSFALVSERSDAELDGNELDDGFTSSSKENSPLDPCFGARLLPPAPLLQTDHLTVPSSRAQRTLSRRQSQTLSWNIKDVFLRCPETSIDVTTSAPSGKDVPSQLEGDVHHDQNPLPPSFSRKQLFDSLPSFVLRRGRSGDQQATESKTLAPATRKRSHSAPSIPLGLATEKQTLGSEQGGYRVGAVNADTEMGGVGAGEVFQPSNGVNNPLVPSLKRRKSATQRLLEQFIWWKPIPSFKQQLAPVHP